MEYELIFEALSRHFYETRILLEQLTDEVLFEAPVQSGRSLGDVVMHLIRSLEYYSQGLSKDVWTPLNYSLDEFSTALKIKNLFAKVITRSSEYLADIERDSLKVSHEKGNRPAKRGDVLLEMLEHSVQHRGQILVYYRLLGIEPVEIPYII
ncbi:MAG: DinB family protein [Candidatus Hodarchaeales archaeon]|jgi:uncharacterized damage-inducible protein DinB